MIESSMYTLLSKACVASVVSQKRHGYVGARAQSVRARVGSTGGLKAVHAYMERCLLLIGVSHRCMQTRLGSSYALTLVVSQSALRTMFKALLVAVPPLLEMCNMNGTKITEWCQGCGH